MLFVLTLALTCAAVEPIRVEERRPLSVVLLAPLGELSVIDASAVIAGLSQQLKAKTDLEVVALETERTADCAGELGCLIERTGARPPLFLVLSAVKSKKGDRISATLVDVKTRAALLRPEWSEIAVPAELDRWIGELIAVKLRPMLEERGAWEPFGEIAIEGLPNGAAIALDGVTRGVSAEGSLRLAGVRPGRRTLSFEHAAVEAKPIDVVVERGAVATVTPTFTARGAGARTFRKTLFWTGAGASLLGSGIAIYGLAKAGGDNTVCLTNDVASSSCAGSSPFYREGGVALAPLGYSIALTGVLWALGALWLGDEHQAPWLAIGVGAGAGVISFSLSTGLD